MSQFQPPNQWGNQRQQPDQWRPEPGTNPQYQPPQFYPYQEPPPQPPKKNRPSSKSFLKTLGGIVAILIFLVVVASVWASSQAQPTVPDSTSVAPTSAPVQHATTAPTQPPSKPTQPSNPQGKVGTTYSIGIWNVTLNSVSTSTGTEFDSPKAGNIYVSVDVTAQNTSSSPQLLADGVMFVFQDQSGQSYDETFVSIGKPPEGNVPAGSKLRGQLVYEVSKSLHHLTLTFQDSAYDANSATWSITV